MDKRTPSLARSLLAVSFAFSCFAVLLFLWLSFGGPIPLKAQGYRFEVSFREGTQLPSVTDVVISGVTVGKVLKTELDPDENRQIATLEMEQRYSPVPKNTRAILRLKTISGETFVELSPGSGPKLPENDRLPNANVEDTGQFDELLDVFDGRTRKAFRTWQQDYGSAIVRRGRGLNQAFGRTPDFLDSGTDLLEVLDNERFALRRLVKNTGVVFGALTRRERQLRKLVVNTHDVFQETARRNERLAETIQVLPAFLAESRSTFARTQRFAVDSRPVVRLLRPPTRDLGPTIADVRRLAPDLERTFVGIRKLVPVSKRGLPAFRDTLKAVRPVFERLGPFLSEVNPILEMLEQNQYAVGDFFSNGPAGLADTLSTNTPGAIGHYLRQFSPNGVEGAGIYRERLDSNRGNGYLRGVDLSDPRGSKFGMFANWDCKTLGFEGRFKEGPRDGSTERYPSCFVGSPSRFKGKVRKFPHVERENYTRGRRGVPGSAP